MTVDDRQKDEVEGWWISLAERLGVDERCRAFFHHARRRRTLDRVHHLGGQADYVLFVLTRYWLPVVLPPVGRERYTKNEPDYWLESQQILKSAVLRLRELKPLIELLTAQSPVGGVPSADVAPSAVEVDLARMLEGIAEVAGSYGGPDYTSVIKRFDPIPLRQTQPFKHNKKHSAELWVVFLLREHMRSLGIGKDRYWPVLAEVAEAADILQPTGQPYSPDELKSWWQKNWPRTYTQLEQGQQTGELTGAAYQHDFEWFQSWIEWQQSRHSIGEDG
ncbi:hypothetical protein YTPLAS18_03900 [Nitrospira sp.]|nr:hypothetical protein YTPLAS18_03900 [Nitrospira sp.]